MNKRQYFFLAWLIIIFALILSGCKGELSQESVLKLISKGLEKCQTYETSMDVLTGLQNNTYTLRIHYKSPDKYRLVSGDSKRITIFDGKNTFLINKGIPDQLTIEDVPFYPHHMLPHHLLGKLLESRDIRLGEHRKELNSILIETVGILNNGKEGTVRYWLSTTNGFPLMVEQYDTNGLLVWGVNFSDFKLNIDIDDEVFSPQWED